MFLHVPISAHEAAEVNVYFFWKRYRTAPDRHAVCIEKTMVQCTLGADTDSR